MPTDESQYVYQDRSPRLEFGEIKQGETINKKISLRYFDAGDHQLRVTLYAASPEDPTDRVNTTCFKSTTISISIPFQAETLSRYDPSSTPPVPLLSPERMKPDFFEKICEAIFYAKILQNTGEDLTIHDIKYTHIVSSASLHAARVLFLTLPIQDSANSRLIQTSLDVGTFPDRTYASQARVA